MAAIPPPEPLKLGSQLETSWKYFKSEFAIYLQATKQSDVDTKVKAGIFLIFIGRDARDLMENWAVSTADKEKYEKLVEIFDEKIKPKAYPIHSRNLFRHRLRFPGEDLDDYVVVLKRMAKDCDFAEGQEDLEIIDNIVDSTKDVPLYQLLIKQTTTSAAAIIAVVKEQERVQAASSQIKTDTNVHNLRSSKNGSKWKSSKPREQSRSRSTSSSGRSNTQSRSPSPSRYKSRRRTPVPSSFKHRVCRRCDSNHKFGECPAEGSECRKCGKLNHFTECCFAKSLHSVTTSAPSVSKCENSASSDQDYTLLHNLECSARPPAWYETVIVNGQPISFKLDSGAECNTLPTQVFSKLNLSLQSLSPMNAIWAYGHQPVKSRGKIKLPVECKLMKTELEFVHIEANEVPVLSLQSCIQLNLIERVHSMQSVNQSNVQEFIAKNRDLFEGLGTFPGTVELMVDESVEPKRYPPRRYPQVIKTKVQTKLEEMEAQNVIVKCDKPKSWVSAMVVDEKPDQSLRLCMDPMDLNAAMLRPYFEIPCEGSVQSNLSGKGVFSVFDLKDGFHNCVLDEKSSDLCVFSTPFGCYKYKRMPFGLSVAPEIFQKKCEEYFGDLPGVNIFFDDMIISGTDMAEHDANLDLFLTRARAVGIKFNPKKLQLRLSKVKYLGHIYSKEGRSLDPRRISAIVNLQSPQNKKQLQQLLGMINYEREFIPNLASLMDTFRPLLKKNNSFQWLDCHEEALERIKTIITQAPVLANFDAKADILIQCDASKCGLGACLFQNNRPVAYASRCLTTAEQSYAMVEKEMLAIVYAVAKFHYFVYGRRNIVIHTDHKPLEAIFQKSVSQIGSTRLQALRLKLMNYDLKVKYIPGSQMHIADLLSRNSQPEEKGDEYVFRNVIHSVTACLPVSRPIKENIVKATKEDKDLQLLKQFVLSGWPLAINKLPSAVKPYWQLRHEIHLDNDILYYKDRAIIPKSLRVEMLSKLHEGHLGVSKTSGLAAQTVFWPNIYGDIVDLIHACEPCAKYSSSNRKEPMEKRELPDRPWSHLAVDIFFFEGKDYLVVVDVYSKWLEVFKLKSKTAGNVTRKLTKLFGREGAPDKIYADNNPFNSQECLSFAEQFNFEFTFSSPRYPQSNGQAESAVKIAKALMKKCKEDKTDFHLALLNYRNCKIEGLDASPSQLLHSRRNKAKLPITEQMLKPQVQQNVRDKLEMKQNSCAKWYNRGATKKVVTFNEKQNVYVQSGKVWEPANVVKASNKPRSYIVKTRDGTYERTSRQLKGRYDGKSLDKDCTVILEPSEFIKDQLKQRSESDTREDRSENEIDIEIELTVQKIIALSESEHKSKEKEQAPDLRRSDRIKRRRRLSL